MPMKDNVSLRRWYGIGFLVLTVLLGLAFLLQAANIYYGALDQREAVRAEILSQAEQEGWSEDDTSIKVAQAVYSIPIYSREIVGQRLKAMIPWICVWGAALIGAIVVAHLCPAPADRHRDKDIMLDQKLKAARARLPQTPKEGQQEEFDWAISQYQQLRRQEWILTLIVAVCTVACLILPVLYLLNGDNFPKEDITGEVAAAAWNILPAVAVLAADYIAYVYVRRQIMREEQAALKTAIAAGEPRPQAPVQKKIPWVRIARISLATAGVALVILGIFNGSMQDVLTKAIKICTECIGLG